MKISVKLEDALIKISERIKYLNNAFKSNLEFVGFKRTWNKFSEAVVLIKCLKHDLISEFSLGHFLGARKMFYCEKCREESLRIHKKFNTREEALIAINEKIKVINSKGYNIEFQGFVNNEFSTDTSKTNLIIKCNIHNTTQTPCLHDFLMKETFCVKCLNSKSHRKTNKQIFDYLNSLDLGYDFSLILEEDELGGDYNRRITAICPKHGKFVKSLQAFSKNNKTPTCDKCKEEERLKKLADLTEEKSENVLNALKIRKNENKSSLEFLGFVGGCYKNNTTNLILKCNTCGYVWKTTKYCHIVRSSGGTLGCPCCANKKTAHENFCYKILTEQLGLNVRRNYYIKCYDEETKTTRNLKPDFYIESLNLIIEYDGEQHYKFINLFHDGDINNYKDQVRRDQLKTKYCRDNGINLLRITFKNNYNLEEVIKTYINTGVDITIKVTPEVYD